MHSSTESKYSSAITVADKERVIEPRFLTGLPLVLPLRDSDLNMTEAIRRHLFNCHIGDVEGNLKGLAHR
jgi:hypothetical protein